jgi:hypothetical protein
MPDLYHFLFLLSGYIEKINKRERQAIETLGLEFRCGFAELKG